MKNQLTLLIVFIIIILVAIVLALFYSEEDRINQAIEQANYCTEASDCVDAGGKCPFDCYVFVNKNEVGRIGEMIKNYNSNCVYGCAAKPPVECINNKCEMILNTN